MSIDVEATYENGVLRLERPLPLREHERVLVSVRPRTSRIRQSAGLVPWTGNAEALEHLLGPQNASWERS